jgi:hypothetical protein
MIVEKVEMDVVHYAIDRMYEIVKYMDKDDTFDIDELHHRLFNEDYFIIGYYNASEWFKKNDLDAFDVIEYVQEYERDRFGETNTKVNSESMANMYAYIRGEELLNSLNLDYSNTTYSKSKMNDILLELRKLDKQG